MYIHSMPKRVIPWSAIMIAILLTIDGGYQLYQNSVAKQQIELTIKDVQEAAAMQAQMSRQQQRSGVESSDKKFVEDPHTIELEALGVKLKLVNEATWTGIFKLCFLWGFVVATLIIYRKLNSK